MFEKHVDLIVTLPTRIESLTGEATSVAGPNITLKVRTEADSGLYAGAQALRRLPHSEDRHIVLDTNRIGEIVVTEL